MALICLRLQGISRQIVLTVPKNDLAFLAT